MMLLCNFPRNNIFLLFVIKHSYLKMMSKSETTQYQLNIIEQFLCQSERLGDYETIQMVSHNNNVTYKI